jgi:3-oxosteroid 1-dehydrogenase
MNEAWWAPSVRWGDRTVILFFEKSKPGLMIVDRTGRRFMNESITYNSYGKCMYGEDYDLRDRVPAYVIFDSRYRSRYMFGGLLQSSMSPDWMNPGAFGPKGMLTKASTLGELAVKLGIDADGLQASAVEMARFAQSGIDERFGRGADAHDRMYGDERVTPNPCLGPIDAPPFYGAPLYPGDIGTKGGLAINNDGQVLDEAGKPIAGLYAAGNSSASIMGDKYPGAGCTLGPALTIAYRAAGRIMGANED